jgi:L-asparagine transporter-like permease
MMSIAMFGAMFTWLMIFITHLFFRRRHADQPLAFRMWGYPWSTLAGAGLMLAILITTAFTPEFRMTLLSGVPFLVLLSVVFLLRNGRAQFIDEPAPEINSDEVRL